MSLLLLFNQSGITPPTPIIEIDTHDGDYYGKKFKKEREQEAKRRAQIVNAYEILVEGRPEVAEELAAPFVVTVAEKNKSAQKINFDAMFSDLDRVQKIFDAYVEFDDEEVLLLL